MESYEKEIRTLEAEIKNLQIKKANIEIEVHSFEKRKDSLADDISTFEQKKALALGEYKKEQARLQDIKKEGNSIKDDCRTEVDKVKKEWDDMADEYKKLKDAIRLVNDDRLQITKDRQALKEDARKLLVKQANLDQQQASLKTEKEKQDVREKGLMDFARLTNNRDIQSLADSANLKKEGERLAFIGKSLDSKKMEFNAMQSLIQQRSNDLDLREKNLKMDSNEIEAIKDIYSDKVKEAEASKKQYSDAYAGLAQKEKEVEIKRLQLIKIGKEKMTDEILRQLEKDANT